MAGRGRPSKLTPEAQERLCNAVRAGNYYEAACAYAGVDYATFRRWMEKGQKAKAGQYRDLCDAVQKAQADAEATVVAQWRQQIPENWQAARDFLARRFPDRWGPKDRHEVSGPGGAAIPISLEEVARADREVEEWERSHAAGHERNGHPTNRLP